MARGLFVGEGGGRVWSFGAEENHEKLQNDSMSERQWRQM